MPAGHSPAWVSPSTLALALIDRGRLFCGGVVGETFRRERVPVPHGIDDKATVMLACETSEVVWVVHVWRLERDEAHLFKLHKGPIHLSCGNGGQSEPTRHARHVCSHVANQRAKIAVGVRQLRSRREAVNRPSDDVLNGRVVVSFVIVVFKHEATV